jgi:hypothetical protein
MVSKLGFGELVEVLDGLGLRKNRLGSLEPSLTLKKETRPHVFEDSLHQCNCDFRFLDQVVFSIFDFETVETRK